MNFLGFLEYASILAAFWFISLDPNQTRNEILAIIFFALWAVVTMITVVTGFFEKKESEPVLNVYNYEAPVAPAFHPVGRDARGRFISQVKQHDLEVAARKLDNNAL